MCLVLDSARMARRRNPPDSTTRNVRASVKRIKALVLVLYKLTKSVHQLRLRVDAIEARLSERVDTLERGKFVQRG